MNTQKKQLTRRGWYRSWGMLAATAVVAGCAGRPALLPNSDKTLRRTSAQFAADAAKRTYEADAPKTGDAAARAEVDYTLKEVRIVNLSPDDWQDIEVWVNQHWVVHIPSIPHQAAKTEGYRIFKFQMLYDNNGNSLPLSKVHVEKVEVFFDGKMHNVPVRLSD